MVNQRILDCSKKVLKLVKRFAAQVGADTMGDLSKSATRSGHFQRNYLIAKVTTNKRLSATVSGAL